MNDELQDAIDNIYKSIDERHEEIWRLEEGLEEMRFEAENELDDALVEEKWEAVEARHKEIDEMWAIIDDMHVEAETNQYALEDSRMMQE